MKKTLMILSLLAAAPAWACNNGSFYGGKAPTSTIETQTLCESKHSVGYSNVSRTGIWSAAHLTQRSVAQAKMLKREGKFFEDRRVKNPAKISDYNKSGYDRGHLYPSGDAPDMRSQQESFSLVNIIPQSPKLNRGRWADLESRTRMRISFMGEAYVVTGAGFEGKTLTYVGQNKVLVPTHVWKAVYFPKFRRSGVAIAENKDDARIQYITLDELEKRFGVVAFPAIPKAERKATALRW